MKESQYKDSKKRRFLSTCYNIHNTCLENVFALRFVWNKMCYSHVLLSEYKPNITFIIYKKSPLIHNSACTEYVLFTSQREKMLYFSTQEHNTTTCHPGNLKSITPRGKSKIFLFACEHHSHFHPLANQTKSDQAIKRLSVTPRGAFSKLRRQHG